MSRRPAALLLALLLGAASLPGCASLLGPRTFTLTEDDLAQRLATRFPVDRRVLELLDLRIGTPRVTLKPETNRVGIELDLSLAEQLSQRAFPLAVALDSSLRYDAAQSAIKLADVRVLKLSIEGLPEALVAPMQRLGAPLLEQLLEGGVVHRFTPEQLQLAQGQGLRPDAIAVTPRGVEISLLPIAR